jgi:hypothetical protein
MSLRSTVQLAEHSPYLAEHSPYEDSPLSGCFSIWSEIKTDVDATVSWPRQLRSLVE